jgi:phytoene synthase
MDDIDFCAEQLRRLDHDRYLTTLFAPAPVRPALIALYAFNTEIARVRETVSEKLIGQMRLQWWRDAIGELAAGKRRDHPVARALGATLARGLAPDDFEPMLVGRGRDLDDTPFADLAALEDYAEATSASLLRAALKVCGADQPAHHAGIAWALVGHLRACEFHARQRRVYLPADLLARHGVSLDALFEGKRQPGLAAVAGEVAARVAQHLDRARAESLTIPRRMRAPLLLVTLARLALQRLARLGYDLQHPHAALPGGMNALRLAVASITGWV